MRPDRGANGWSRRSGLIRALSCGAMAITCGWAGYSYHAMMQRSKGNGNILSLRAEEPTADKSAAPAAPVSWGEGATTSRAPWDPQGCQTILFFHIPKTGGESINQLRPGIQWWKNAYDWSSYRVTGLELTEQKNHLKSMKPWLRESPSQRHKLIEFHCGDALSFMQAREALETMRHEHAKNDCGFFAFTMVRPPLEWLVSLYDDLCHRRLRGHKETCPQQASIDSMTPKQEMLAYPHKDGLVSYLAHGFNGWASPGPVDEDTVEEMLESFRKHLDLVAFTGEVPQVRRYLTKRFVAPNGILTPPVEDALGRGELQNANNVKTIRLSDFDPDELAQLNSTIQLDWMLYEAVLAMHQPVQV
ncbi:unnamed protein product [Ectocarpus fasciculatus]